MYMSSDPKTQQGNLYRRLLNYAFQYKLFFTLSIFGFIVFSGMDALLIRTAEFFVNALEKKPNDSLSFLPDHITTSIYFVPLVIIILSGIRGIGAFLGNFYMSKVGLNVVNCLRKDVFGQLVYLPQSQFDKNNSGELVSLLIYNIEQVTGSVTNAVKILVRDGFSVIAIFGILLYYNWKLTLVFVLTAPILAGLVYIAGRYFRKISRKIQNAVGRVTHIATEATQGIKLVKSYNGEEYERQRFNQAADENLAFGIKFERVNAAQTPIMHFVIAISLSVIFLLVLLFWDSSTAEAVAYITAAGFLPKPFRQLSTVNSVIQRGMAAAETIFAVLDEEREEDKGTHALGQVKGQIEFDNVCFTYNQDAQALDSVSLTINPGETVALVGGSGSGKTTLTSLLLRFYQVTSGTIRIDGIEINDIPLRDLRNNIALVNQQTILFNDTINANIAYADNNDDTQPEKIAEAATQANAQTFIQELDNGFETLAGESGARLSGGQKQRISIARALYKNAPILVLDEATSALDNESEKQIQLALNKLKQNRTTLVIAHRLSTIENADKIVVMDAGRIVEVGNHQTLLAQNGYYTKLYNAQAS